MKFAILFSGRIKNFKISHEYIMKNIVQSNDVDFFISFEKNTDENELNEFIELFKPKKIFKSDENYFNVEKYPKPHIAVKSRHNMMCMFLNRFYVHKIFDEYCNESGEKYDIIFSLRLDIAIGSFINYNDLISFINNDYLCIPYGNDFYGINDRIAFGNYEVIKKYLNCYEKLFELFENGVVLHPESVLNKYLESVNIKIIRPYIIHEFI